MSSVQDFGNVAVFCGGASHEREISLQSGEAIAGGLKLAGIDAQMVDTAEGAMDFSRFDRVFIALHGRDGEDGKVQSLLEYHNVPYTGSGVAASAVSMNKWYTKAVWQSVGIKTPAYQVVGNTLEPDFDKINYPVYVKPVNEGSSIGISHVSESASLPDAIEKAIEYDDCVLIEQAIRGKEYTFSFIGGVPELPIVHFQPATGFYDYEAKYLRHDTRYIANPPMKSSLKKQCVNSAFLAYRSLAMRGWGRVDFIVDDQSDAWFIEVNSVPGMTSHSLVPMSARAAGFSFSETCVKILRASIYE